MFLCCGLARARRDDGVSLKCAGEMSAGKARVGKVEPTGVQLGLQEPLHLCKKFGALCVSELVNCVSNEVYLLGICFATER
jgi:hypothetical protein